MEKTAFIVFLVVIIVMMAGIYALSKPQAIAGQSYMVFSPCGDYVCSYQEKSLNIGETTTFFDNTFKVINIYKDSINLEVKSDKTETYKLYYGEELQLHDFLVVVKGIVYSEECKASNDCKKSGSVVLQIKETAQTCPQDCS
jgi:hypothetical protein